MAKKHKKSGKARAPAGPPPALVRRAATYAGSVAGCVFTTHGGVTGYYADARQAAKAAKAARAAPVAVPASAAAAPKTKEAKKRDEPAADAAEPAAAAAAPEEGAAAPAKKKAKKREEPAADALARKLAAAAAERKAAAAAAAAAEAEAAPEDDGDGDEADEDEAGAASDTESVEGDAAWRALGLHGALVSACGDLGWAKPTRIQKGAIPVAIGGRDVIGLAETGSGKTGAFGLPILHKLLEKPSRLFGCCLAPTRELAVQIHEVFDALGRGIGLKCVCVVGGVEIAQQALALAKLPHVVIATPGRLVDHLENTKGFALRNCRCLVLDEADRMLSMDFEKELDAIVAAIPREGRTSMLFSATMTGKVAKLQRAALYKPVRVEVNDKFATPRKLEQAYLFVPAKHKECYLTALLDEARGQSALVFCATCAGANRATMLLRNLGFGATCLHGQMAQPKRLGALHAFKSGGSTILVATDVAARGLDIPSVDLVVNYDLPTHGKEYVHRVGRTARAGRAGRAVAFVTQYDVELYQRLEHLLGAKLPKCDLDEDRALAFADRVEEAARRAGNAIREADRDKRGRGGGGGYGADSDSDADGGDGAAGDAFAATDSAKVFRKPNKFAGMKKKAKPPRKKKRH